MPVSKLTMSLSQFAELLGLEPKQFVGIDVNRLLQMVTVLTEPEGTCEVRPSTAWIVAEAEGKVTDGADQRVDTATERQHDAAQAEEGRA